MSLSDMQQNSIAQTVKLGNIEEEVVNWFDKLISNCASDPDNAKAYIMNATKEVNDYIAQSITTQACFETIIAPIQNNRKLRKSGGDLSMVVMPTLIVAKLLQLMNQRLEA